MLFNLDAFINQYVTEREESLFAADLKQQQDTLAAEIDGERVLVIGGAGSIGSSFVRALLRFRPAALYVIDVNENGLTELTRDLRSTPGLNVPREYKTYAIDFGGEIFADLIRQQPPFGIVANFAAHKHVRSEKDGYSIRAMVRNNVISNYRLLQLLSQRPPAHFFCVSTDKAANPVNVMGATKKLMERVLFSFSDRFKIVSARFANVAFSNGSLPLSFLDRLMKQQPIVAPTDVKRYFVSPEESGQLCLLACILGRTGEIFFPRLREDQMKVFSDIATDFLREYGGYTPEDHDTDAAAREAANRLSSSSTTYPVNFFVSDTSGEKSFEEFYIDGEQVDTTRFVGLGVISGYDRLPAEGRAFADEAIERLERFSVSTDHSKKGIVRLLEELVPSFRHIETGKSLDQKM
jgi:FlaA1/EpsC-like NDP-sugar epimerase